LRWDDIAAIRKGIEGTSFENQLEPESQLGDQVSAQEPVDNDSAEPINVEVTAFDDPTKTFDTIMGMTDTGDELCFLIAFKINGQDPFYEVIPTRIANLKIPMQIIHYYESRVSYSAE